MIVLVVLVAVLVAVYVRPRVLAQPPAALLRLPGLAPVPATALAPPAAWRPSVTRPVPAWQATVALGLAETRRALRAPLFLAALAIVVLNVTLPEPTEFAVYNAFALAGPAALYSGLVCYFAGNLAGTRARRSGTEELAAPAPLPPRLRVLALAMPAVAVGAAVLAVLAAGWVYWWDVRDLAFARPGGWHLLSTPVQCTGGFALGVMVATWAPYRGVAPVGFVGLVTLHIALANTGNAEWGAFVEYARWPDQGGGFEPLSAAWHTTYLLLLTAMAVVGAVVWLPGRRRGLLAFGALLTLATLGAGLAQLP